MKRPKHKRSLRDPFILRASRKANKWLKNQEDPLSYENPLDYTKATPNQMLSPWNTAAPKIYAVPNHELRYELAKAIKAFQPEINFQLTSNKLEASIDIYIEDLYFDKPSKHAPFAKTIDKYKAKTSPLPEHRTINIYQWMLKKYGCDGLGLRLVLMHELGHALGLKHDQNPKSIMSITTSWFINKKMRPYFKLPILTKDNRKMLRRMYYPKKPAKSRC